MNGGTCHDMINSFKCSCPRGFTGSRCQTNIDECESNPCKNRGICHDEIAGYSCECPAGFTGELEAFSTFASHVISRNIFFFALFSHPYQAHHVRSTLTSVPATLASEVIVLTVRTPTNVNAVQDIRVKTVRFRSTSVSRILAKIKAFART